MTDQTELKTQHTLLANGIHEIVLKEYGMSGADDVMNQLESLYQGRTASDPTLRILVINGSGALPITYSLQRAKELNDKYPNIGLIRVVILSDSAFEARLIDSFMRIMRFPGIRMRFFDVARRPEAEQWLLQNA